jgi:hypothetical protein
MRRMGSIKELIVILGEAKDLLFPIAQKES